MEKSVWILLVSVSVLGPAVWASRRERCLIGSVPTHRGFDVNKFAGTWYFLTMLKGTADFSTAVSHFVVRNDQLMTSYFTAVKDGTCQAEISGSWHTGNRPGEMYTDFVFVTGPARIVYVNPDYTYAVIYQCFQVNPNGTCAMKFVDFLGRGPRLPPDVRRQLMTRVRGMCVRNSDLTDMSPQVPHCLRTKVREYAQMDSMMGDSPSFLSSPLERMQGDQPVPDREGLVESIIQSDEVLPPKDKSPIIARPILRNPDGITHEHGETDAEPVPQERRRDGAPVRPKQILTSAVVRDDESIIEEIEENEELAGSSEEIKTGKRGSLGPKGAEPGTAEGESDTDDDDDDDEVDDREGQKFLCLESECLESCPRKLMRVDENGCDVCTCESSVPAVDPPCATPMCRDRCPNGYVYTEQGCMTCECREGPIEDDAPETVVRIAPDPVVDVPCATPMCSDRCPNGYVYTERGCMTCECRETPIEEQAPESIIRIAPDPVFEVPCATPMCSDRCPNGYVYTEEGCMTCECRESPIGEGAPESIIRIAPDPVVEVPCATPMCRDRCPNGYVYTEEGCMTCECKGEDDPEDLSILVDHSSEPAQLLKNSNDEIELLGTAREDTPLVEDPATMVKLSEVPIIRTPDNCPQPLCAENCLNGFVYTEQGCMTCDCKAAPTPAEPSSICKVQDIPVAPNLNITRFAGRWYILSMLQGTAHFTAATIHLHVHNDSVLSSFFSASSQNKPCFPTVEGSWRKTGSQAGEFVVKYAQNSGPLKVVYVDPAYTLAIVYQCFRVNSDGTCQRVYVDLIGREPLLPATARTALMAHVHKTCADANDFSDLAQSRTCTIALPDLVTRSCKVSDFPTVTDLDWTRMLGHWYTVVQPRDGENIQAGEYVLKPQQDGAVSIVFHAYREGECIEPRRATIYPNPDNPGELTLQVGHSKSEGRIIFTDYNSMVFYQCSRHDAQGACAVGQDTVEVLHRQRHPTRHLVDYLSIIRGLCIHSDRVGNVSHEITCPIRDFCKVDAIPSQTDLHIDRLSGRWHTVASLKSDMTWDDVTAVFTQESPTTMGVWYTGAGSGECQPTSRALLQKSPTNNMTLSFGRTKAIFKVIYADDLHAVTYECERKSRDSHCSQHAEHLEILSRREGERLSEQLLEELAPHLRRACKEKEDVKATVKEVDCPIQRPPSACKLDYLPTPRNFDLKRFMGRWYTVAKNKRIHGISSVYVEMSLSGTSTIHTTTHLTRRGICVAGTQKTMTSRPQVPSEFVSFYGRQQMRARVIYVSSDYQAAVVYQCGLEDPQGSCAQGHAKVNILSRSTSITAGARTEITDALISACVDPASMHDMMDTGECTPGTPPPPGQTPCSIDSIPAIKKLNDKQLLGRWYILWRMRGSPTLDGDATLTLTVGEGTAMHARYTGSRRVTCVPPVDAEWRLRSTDQLSDFTVTSRNATGRLKIIYTDYQHALVYECHNVLQNGQCVEGHDSLDLYSRSRAISPDVRTQLFKQALNLCLDAKKLTAISHDTDCENVGPEPCSMGRVPVVTQVNLPELMGTWYSASRLAAASSWHAGVVNFDLLEDGNVLAKHGGARKGRCMKVTSILLKTVPGRAEFKKPNGGLIKLAFTNYQQALIYDCDKVVDNECVPGHMTADVLSRSPDPLPATFTTPLLPFLTDMCLREIDFRTTPTNVDCTQTLFEQEQCSIHLEDISVQSHFDINMLLGEWYRYAQTNDDNPLTSIKSLLSRDDEGNLKLYRTGARSGRCIPMTEATVEVTDDNPAYFIVYYNGRREHLLILHASPDELVMYVCDLKLPDGSCAQDHNSVQVLRRRHNMLAALSASAKQAVTRACFSHSQLRFTTQDVDCTLQIPHASCAFTDLPVDKNFDLRAMTGHWYTVSRLTPRGDTKRKSSRNYIVYKSRDSVTSMWTAKIGTRCVDKTKGSMEALSDHTPGTFRSNFGSWTSVTKFIHLSSNYAITFECVQPTGSTTFVTECPLEDAEVEIHSRRPQTPQTAINVLKDILRQKTCIDVNRMDDMLPEDSCPLNVKPEKSCHVDEIPMHPNVTVPMLAGAWFQISRTDTASVLPRHHGELFIDAGNHHQGTVTMLLRGKTGDSLEDCEPVFRVQTYSSTLDRAHWFFMADSSMGARSGTLKVVHVDRNLLVLHTCLSPSPVFEGLCHKNKEAVQVYSHRRYLNQRDHATLKRVLANKLCVDERDLHRTTHTERCGIPRYVNRQRGPKSCRVEDYRAQADFQPQKFAGVWYEIERTRFSHLNHWESTVSHISHQPPHGLAFSHAGSKDGQCVGPFRAHLTPTPNKNSSAEMTMWLGQRALVGSPWSIHFPYKVIWTDYQAAVVYSCHQVADDGRCRHQGEQVHVISRSPEVNKRTRVRIYKIISHRLCVDVVDLVEPEQEADCVGIFGLDLAARQGSSGAPCRVNECSLSCPHGYAQNEAGCPLCLCRQSETQESGASATGGTSQNGDGSGEEDPLVVSMDTPGHMISDVSEGSGEVNEPIKLKHGGAAELAPVVVCAPIKCLVRCATGYRRDHRGCLTCQCRTTGTDMHTDPESGTSDTKCRPTVCLFLYCPFGFQKDANGCTICACAKGQEPAAGHDTKVRLFWVNKGLGTYGIRRAIVEPYIKSPGSAVVADQASEKSVLSGEKQKIGENEEQVDPEGSEDIEASDEVDRELRSWIAPTEAPERQRGKTTEASGILQKLLSYL